jgi:SpoVK/Ycf46/Vps4 family AAA+-type ATPase
MPNSVDSRDPHLAAFSEAVDDCLELYRSSAEAWNRSLAARGVKREESATRSVMEDLARGLLVKIFLTIMQADRRFCAAERRLAQVLIEKLWGRHFADDEIGAVMRDLVPMADKFDWYRLLRPFEEVLELHERVGEVETVAMRVANLVAKADGRLAPEEAVQLKGLLAEIHRHLLPVPIEHVEASAGMPVGEPIESGRLSELAPVTVVTPSDTKQSSAAAATPPTKEERLKAALQSLEELIGLGSVKGEVRELIRFLQVQQHREAAGLPRTAVSLHTVFTGNPGTGKTSVARILGEVFGALGIVKRGHLVEADRSALVAGYVGQTAERTNKIIDKALDGVLFIDEAYALVSEEGDDPYGHEAVQILLKRMEDERARLIVVLAGYPAEMQGLLESNPGLTSRFNRTLQFPDYGVVELCRIFENLCEKNHYVLPAETRARLILGFRYLLEHRDEHFGNGRLVRNVFEMAIRRLADRIADIAPLTKELLTRLEPADIALAGVPESAINAEAASQLQLAVTCTGCGKPSRIRAQHLGRRVKCRKCGTSFDAEWGEPASG